jgi:hypothetical protein
MARRGSVDVSGREAVTRGCWSRSVVRLDHNHDLWTRMNDRKEMAPQRGSRPEHIPGWGVEALHIWGRLSHGARMVLPQGMLVIHRHLLTMQCKIVRVMIINGFQARHEPLTVHSIKHLPS